MKLKELLNEKSYKVDEDVERDVKVNIDFVDYDTDKEVYKFVGTGTIGGIHRTGTISTYSSDKYGDDSYDDTDDDYDNAEFELTKETEKKINDWLKKNNYKIDDHDYYEFDLKKEKIGLGYTVKKIK